jgi:hypothetical protein
MPGPVSRRGFLDRGTTGAAALLFGWTTSPAGARAAEAPGLPFVDFHAHLDAVSSLDELLAIAERRGVRFGVVEHAGTKANRYPGLLSTDADLDGYLARLEGKPVFRGIQAEGLDWMSCFSRERLARLDYVLSDALTLPEEDGRPVRLWQPDVEVPDPQGFMDRYVDFHVQVMATEPIDILANPTFLPASIEKDFDRLWTPARMKKVVDAARTHRVAIEINSRYRLPRRPFLDLSREAGLKFSFGSNFHGPEVGDLGYCREVAREMGLRATDLFAPPAPGEKAVERRARATTPLPRSGPPSP